MPWQLDILLGLKTASFGITNRTRFRNIASLWNVLFRIPVMCKVQGPVDPKCNVIRIQIEYCVIQHQQTGIILWYKWTHS